MEFVLLTDKHDATALVACENMDQVTALGWACQGTDSTSAWVIPPLVFASAPQVGAVLIEEGDVSSLHDQGTDLARHPVSIYIGEADHSPLPEFAEAVVRECIAEAWRCVEANGSDAHAEDVAADIMHRLTTVWLTSRASTTITGR